MQKYHDFIERRKEERWRLKERGQAEKDHKDTIISAADGQPGGFWCDTCGKDYQTTCYKRTGSLGRWPVAWYKGKCPCGKWNMVRITDKSKDIYYFKSLEIRKQRRDVDYATIDPNHELFPIIYPKQYRDLEKKKYEHV